MEKKITFDGYNVVTIKKLYPNGDCLCDLRCEVVTDESTQITKQDTDIIFSKPYPFELTEDYLNTLTPKQMNPREDLPDNGGATAPTKPKPPVRP